MKRYIVGVNHLPVGLNTVLASLTTAKYNYAPSALSNLTQDFRYIALVEGEDNLAKVMEELTAVFGYQEPEKTEKSLLELYASKEDKNVRKCAFTVYEVNTLTTKKNVVCEVETRVERLVNVTGLV